MRKLALIVLIAALHSSAHAQGFVANWLDMVTRSQAEQPRWITPVVTVTPRLEQEVRYDVVHSQSSTGDFWNIGNGKGLELIPSKNVELIINVPPYFAHENPAIRDGFGDMSFLMKYRIASRNEKEGNYIVTAFLSGSIPTGSYKNGAAAAVVTPTLAAGKGWGKWSVQSTIGIGLPVDTVEEIGHAIQFNNALQYHVRRYLWPEVEANATFFSGGTRDGMKQLFLTPGLVFGKFPIHNRVGLTIGAGFQIAVTQFHTNNHNLVMTFRMPF
jgi:hypothetical protein